MAYPKQNFDIWFDLETTGLQYGFVQQADGTLLSPDVILEIACIVTDMNLNVKGTFERVLKLTDEAEACLNRNKFCLDMHTGTGLLDACRSSRNSLEEVESDFFNFLSSLGVGKGDVLAGNSVSFDKCMLKLWMPRVDDLLSYQVKDVSSIWRMHSHIFGEFYVPVERPAVANNMKQHRAMYDVLFSIEQYKALTSFFKKKRTDGAQVEKNERRLKAFEEEEMFKIKDFVLSENLKNMKNIEELLISIGKKVDCLSVPTRPRRKNANY